jgi:hypothetical protein
VLDHRQQRIHVGLPLDADEHGVAVLRDAEGTRAVDGAGRPRLREQPAAEGLEGGIPRGQRRRADDDQLVDGVAVGREPREEQLLGARGLRRAGDVPLGRQVPR